MDVQGNTTVITFRLPSYTVKLLRKEAGKRHLSVNALLNELVNSYFEFHSIAESIGMMPVPKRLVKDMLDMLDITEISRLAKLTGQYDFAALVYMKKSNLNRDTFLESFLCWLDFSSFPYQESVVEGEYRMIVIQHKMGLKWSEFLAELLETILNDLGVKVSTKKLPDMLIVTISRAY